MEKDIIYEAKIKVEGGVEEKYLGSCATTFKERFRNHKKSFELERYKTDTSMSVFVWERKKEGKKVDVEFKVVKKAKSFTPESGRCQLCLEEKYLINKAKENGESILNKRSEIFAKCRHRSRFLLKKLGEKKKHENDT